MQYAGSVLTEMGTSLIFELDIIRTCNGLVWISHKNDKIVSNHVNINHKIPQLLPEFIILMIITYNGHKSQFSICSAII